MPTIDEIAPEIYRISTFVPEADLQFAQFLVRDDEPLLFHSGPRMMFPLVRDAVATLVDPASIRWIGFSHFEADECGSLNDFLAAATAAVPVCSQVAAMVSVDDFAVRPARALADGEVLLTGRHAFRWFDTPHVPHGWESGLMMEITTHTLLCGDLFTQSGSGSVAITEGDILGPSEAFRQAMDYYAHTPQTAATLERLAREQPQVLACMHGSAWQGDGAKLLRALGQSLAGRQVLAQAA
jgi:flavorubredoxin